MRLSAIAKKMIMLIGASSLVFIAAGVIYHRSLSALPFILGVLMVAALNCLKAVLLERAVEKAANMDEGKSAANYIRGQYLVRFVLTGAVLIVAAKNPQIISLWGAIAGIFTWQIAALLLKFFIGDDKQAAKNEDTTVSTNEP